ncbi:MAG TPA: Hsp20/alpha crystallin family protein, partial [Candidatus Dojkabacteria bacterium]|nr:Hsp20/alpha crystallin family protein [Candidatus Dojkabacteria bacterium]
MKIIKQDSNNRSYPTYMPLRSIFDDFFTPSIWETPFTSQSLTSADIWEEKDDIFVKMALPGVNKEDIKISIMEDSINISGQTKKEEEDKKEKKYYYRS